MTKTQLGMGAARRYEATLVPSILGQATQLLVEQALIMAGQTILDVGTGTGAAERRANERLEDDGCIIGVDINPGMITVAKSLPHAARTEMGFMAMALLIGIPFISTSLPKLSTVMSAVRWGSTEMAIWNVLGNN